MDPVKVAGVRDWPTPTRLVEVQSFLGFCNFYRRFIKNFSRIAHPLHALQKKDAEWRWGEEEKKAFAELQSAITSSPVLIHPSPNKPFKLETDSSDYASDAVLSQEGEDGKWHPVGFYSKSLDEVQCNYDVHDKELLSVIRALEEWRHLLEGTKHTVEIFNDHRNLTYFQTAQKLNRRQARWALFLSRFDFKLLHQPGKSAGKPDALSRRADHNRGEEDNQNRVLLPSELFAKVCKVPSQETAVESVLATAVENESLGGVVLEGADKELMERVKRCKERDEAVVKAFRELGSLKGVLRGSEWSEEDDVVLFNGKIYIPKDDQLRHDIVHLHHDSVTAGHPGRWKTLELVTHNYWWPGVSRYVAKYVRGCVRAMLGKQTKPHNTTDNQ